MAEPFRISFAPYVDISDDRLAGNLEAAKGYERVQRGVHAHPVAVVGGGASLLDHLDELKGWPGEIWAVNSMADWLGARGIKATLFSVDPAWIEVKAQSALLASCCHPCMFEREDLRVFDMLEHADGGIIGGVTTAARAPALAVKLGYPGVAFFGCDSSFADLSHLSHNDYADYPMLIVRANGSDYKTIPDFVMQAESLAQLIRTFPDYFVCKSDGLLPAMVADEQWTTVAVSAALKQKLIETNGDSGMYDEPYRQPTEEKPCLIG
jgi:hypothetical protein